MQKREIDEVIEQYKDCQLLIREQVVAFASSLNEHITYVCEAGEKLNVPQEQLDMHDWSKWEKAQFPYYARQFCGGESPVDAESVTDDFALAWLDHIHKEKHHWQHWIFPDAYTPSGSNIQNGVVEMPENYVLEMVADWMGASKAYTDSWDMTKWLESNLPKIRMHSYSRIVLSEILTELGYEESITSLI